ncbi:MAG: fluoride efflux transporter CrcB [Candidatus Nitrosotenuis sp.]
MIAFKNILMVRLGSSAGGALRYVISICIPTKGSSFPWGTFVVNVVGCFVMGLFIGIIQKHDLQNSELKLLLATGFCGGFTTFSAFAFENLELLKLGNSTTLLTYALGSVILGILAVWVGTLLVR